jgi:hypothetical protein
MKVATFLYTGLDSCGVKWWASRPITETGCYNALVHGGRCQNENPFEYQMGCGLDIDISGCYGESLRSLEYPVGLPFVWSWTSNEKPPTLGDWLDSNEKDLVDGLWCAVLNGTLPFEQDLVFSKLVKVRDIRKAVWTAEQENGDIPTAFVMLRREIKNGILTADILRTIRAVASNSEWGAFRNLEVTTAVAYRRQDRQVGVAEWCEMIMKDHGKFRSKPTAGTTADLRSRAWYGVPLEGFVGKLVDERKRFKRIGKDSTLAEVDRLNAQGLDGLLKLLVNTLYGDFASPHFTIGNAVIGNNITARARVGVWMVAKALGLRQSITDGGIYTPYFVCRFKPSRRPGLDTLSRSWEWKADDRARGYCPLGGLDWEATWNALPGQQVLDRLAMDHVQDFWQPYGLDFPFLLEHKIMNTFNRAAYWSKGDYALQTDKETYRAVRGKDKNRRTRKQHPTFALLDNIIAGADNFPSDLEYTKGGIMKIGKYRIVQASNGYEDLKALRPGDNLPEIEHVARYNNTCFPLKDEQDYLHRRNRRKYDRGKSVQWFERYGELGIASVHKGMKSDKMR